MIKRRAPGDWDPGQLPGGLDPSIEPSIPYQTSVPDEWFWLPITVSSATHVATNYTITLDSGSTLYGKL